MRETYGEQVAKLEPNEVFVFGANSQGFHGAGAAGYASFGRTGNLWRQERYDEKPFGWQGKWNVKGCGEGIQQGREGMSYALPTVVRAGDKRSIQPDKMILNIKRMYNKARDLPVLRFLVAGSTSGSLLNGYDHEEMASFYRQAGPVPDNVIFSDSYSALIFSPDFIPGNMTSPI